MQKSVKFSTEDITALALWNTIFGIVSHIPVFSAQHTILDMVVWRLPPVFLDFRRVDIADVEEIPLPDDDQAVALVHRTWTAVSGLQKV